MKKPHRFGLVLGLLVLLLVIPEGGLGHPWGAIAGDPVIGEPFLISDQTIYERTPAVAYNSLDREFLVVWYNDRPYADDDIYAQRVSLTGKLLSWFHVDYGATDAGERRNPAVAYSSQHNDYLIVYLYQTPSGDWDVRGRRVNRNGPQGNEFIIAPSANNMAGQLAVAYNNHPSYDQFLVVWEDGTAAYDALWGLRVAGVASGGTGGTELIGTQNQLASHTDGHCRAPDLAYHAGRNEYLLTYEYYKPGDPTQTRARRITAEGVYTPGEQITISSNGEQPAVAANDDADQYVIVYKYTGGTGPSEIWGYRLKGDFGGIVHTPLVQASDDTVDPEIARLGHSNLYQVVWSEQHTGRGIRGKRIDTSWDSGPAFDIHMASGDYENLPAVADGSPITLVVWEHDNVGITGYDIAGRLLGYKVNLPLILKSY